MPANQPHPDRRAFLTGSLAAATFTALNPLGDATLRAAVVSGKAAKIEPVSQDLTRVRIEIDVKGNVKVPDDALTSREARKTFPVTSKAVLDYEERALRPEGADPASEVVVAERYYHDASSKSVLNKTASEQTLRPELRHTIVRRELLPETIYSQENFFTHGELSLLKSPVSSVTANLFLPGESVIEGDRYEIDRDALCSVLNLTSVDSGKVESTVIEVSEQAVRFKIEGDIEASVDGVSTRQRMIGKMTYDRKFKTCTWLAMAIHETRDISRSEPGFDLTATIRMVLRPMNGPVALPPEPARVDFEDRIPRDRMYVELQSRQLGVGTMMDRRWRMINDAPGSAVMRLIDSDVSIAQCNLRPLVALPEGKTWTLERFEADVRQTLGEKLTRLVQRDQRVSAQGLQVLRVVADGETQGVPIRWIMMHVSDEAGRRVQATFTMSGDQVEAFAGNDAQFADSLRFLDDADVHDGKSDEENSLAELKTESAAGSATPSLEVAGRPDGEEEAISSSDLQ